MHRFLYLALAAAFLVPSANAQGGKGKKKIYSNSYIGKVPPELVMAKGARWLNAEDPVTLSKLKGRVVWLEFSFIH